MMEGGEWNMYVRLLGWRILSGSNSIDRVSWFGKPWDMQM